MHHFCQQECFHHRYTPARTLTKRVAPSVPEQLEVLGAEHERAAKSLEAKRAEMSKRRYLKV